MQLFAMALLLYSCSENETPISDTTDNQARLNFLIKTAPTNKALIHGDDGSFSSLALYIFNKADQHCEYSELIPEFTPQRLEEFSRSVNVSPQTKVIYAIANYNDPDKTFSVPVSPDLTLQQLESLTVSGNAFTDSNILMVGKKEVAINSEYVVAEVPVTAVDTTQQTTSPKTGENMLLFLGLGAAAVALLTTSLMVAKKRYLR